MRTVFTIVPLLFLPLLLNDFWLSQVVTRALILGVTALSLTFLATYLGVVSFAQAAMAGVAGYTIAYFGVNSVNIGYPLPSYINVPLGLIFAAISGALIGLIAHRSRGIYAIMITLAIGVAFFYFTRQNYTLLNGWTGFSGIPTPAPFGFNLRAPAPFYFLCLGVSLAALFLVSGFVRSPMGLAVQAVRDAPSRLLALGIPTIVPIVMAFAFSGLIAGSGGILNVWFQERISSFSVGFSPIIDLLVISVIGGLRHPSGAFLGALIFVLLDTFAADLIDRERFNTLIGVVLLIIIMTAPNGLHQVGLDAFSKIKTLFTKTISPS